MTVEEELAVCKARQEEWRKSLNRRAEVEQALFDVFHGKAPLPDKQQCWDWATKLGVPEEWRPTKKETK